MLLWWSQLLISKELYKHKEEKSYWITISLIAEKEPYLNSRLELDMTLLLCLYDVKSRSVRHKLATFSNEFTKAFILLGFCFSHHYFSLISTSQPRLPAICSHGGPLLQSYPVGR